MKKLGLIFTIFIIAGIVILLRRSPPQVQTQTVLNLAKDVVHQCAKSQYRPTCYEDRIPKLLQDISMEQAFDVTRQVQKLDPQYTYCHVLAHKLASLETRNDPSKWKEVIGRCPASLCSNGCEHGAFQERFREESLDKTQIADILPDLQTACEARPGWTPTGIKTGTCYHAMGHLLMYISKANIPQSLGLCEQIAKKSDGRDLTPVCFDGVFMQLFQPLEPEDFALIVGREQTAQTVEAFCAAFTGQQRVSCRTESWPLFRDQILTADGPDQHCSWLPASDRSRCLNGLFYVAAAQFNLDFAKISDFCSKTSTATRDQCFAQSASRYIEVDWANIDTSVRLCQAAQQVGSGPACFRELDFFSSFNFPAGSVEQSRLCSQIPTEFKNSCQ